MVENTHNWWAEWMHVNDYIASEARFKDLIDGPQGVAITYFDVNTLSLIFLVISYL